MSLPEETDNNRPAGGKTGVVMAILLFLAVISVALFTYLKSQDIDIRAVSLGRLAAVAGGSRVKAAEALYGFSYDPREHPVFSVYRDYIVKSSKDGIRLLDKKGADVWAEAVPLNKPLVRTNGRELLVADVGGQDVYVLRTDGMLWTDRLDVNIINADISREGFVTLVTSSKRYNGEVRVYDIHGIELFRSIIASSYAVSAKISPSGGQMAVDSIDTTGARASTSIKFFAMDSTDLGGKSLEASNSVFPYIYYTDADELIAVGDRAILCFAKDRSIKWEKKFAGVSGACLTGGKRLAAVVDDGGGTKLEVYSSDGRELSACPVEGGIKSMSAGGGLIALSTSREISFYDERCRNVGKYTSQSDISDVYFFSGQQAVVVTRNQVSVIDIG